MKVLSIICVSLVLCLLTGFLPARAADSPSCGIGVQQDVPTSGKDRLTYWAGPTTGWSVVMRIWAPGYTPSSVNDTGGSPTTVDIDSGTSAISEDEPRVTDYNVLGWIQANYQQTNQDDYYAYRIRNQKTSTVVHIVWTQLYIRCW